MNTHDALDGTCVVCHGERHETTACWTAVLCEGKQSPIHRAVMQDGVELLTV